MQDVLSVFLFLFFERFHSYLTLQAIPHGGKRKQYFSIGYGRILKKLKMICRR